MILLLNTIRHFLSTVEKKIGRHSETSFCLYSRITKPNQIIFSDTVNLNVNLEPGVVNELTGEPLSTTEYSSTDIFAIYRILLLNSENALQWQFLTIAIISVFSQRLKVKCSKYRRWKKTEVTHVRRVDATFPFRFTWLSQLHVSPLNKKG